ncbi:MAG: hypothetical protein ACE5I9_05340 [Candidatus Methylomirabilales bacterium]
MGAGLNLLILWIHLLAAIAWLGGMFFFLVVLSPLFHGTFPAREEIQIAYAAGRRYQFVTARAMELLLLTGIFNVVSRGLVGEDLFRRNFLTILGLKLVGFLLMAGLGMWQRISVNQHLAPLIIAGSGGVLGEREWHAIRSRMTWVTRLSLGIGVVVVFLGLMLRGL